VGARRSIPTRKRQDTLPRILIVDDDVAAADALASLTQSSGYGEARVAYTGATAQALAATFLPTVLLVDLDLPDMSGYDVARHLSQHPKLHGLRLIALTSSSEHPGRELAREAGIERYLSQPVGAAELDELFSQAHNPVLTARPKDTRPNKT
jgi:CheY-like chemotaxis protein